MILVGYCVKSDFLSHLRSSKFFYSLIFLSLTNNIEGLLYILLLFCGGLQGKNFFEDPHFVVFGITIFKNYRIYRN